MGSYPHMPSERRKADITIIEKLGDIHTNLALNTQETKRVGDELVKLNGKVVAHESRLQNLEGANAMMGATLTQLHAAAVEKGNEKRDWTDWAIKTGIALLAALFYFLLTKAGF